jgi:Cu+-exporting ATPase
VSAAPSPPESLRFKVTGMRCASCATRVEGLLREQPGVDSASVNFATAEARVVGEPDPVALRLELAREGYALFNLGEEQSAPDEVGRNTARLLRSALLTLPLFAISMLGIEFPRSGWLQALLATPVVLVFGAEFHRGAWQRLRRGSANMDTLVSLGTLAAWGASMDALVRGGPLFFESAAVITTLILLGRNLEGRARGRASQAITRLAALRADMACVLRRGTEHRIPIEELQVGDMLVVRPGEKVPTDSVVVEGRSVLDESMFTGEPKPRPCGPGDELRGASLNGAGRLVARSIRVGGDTILAGVLRMVEETQGARAPVERMVDTVAAWFVPVVLLISCATAVGWLQLGLDPVLAFTRAVAVLVVACPCALGLATPTAIVAAVGRGAELGILFKGSEVFERARRVDVALFDKTGTLTRGEMRLTRVLGCASKREEERLLQLASSLEAASEHSIATAIVEGAEDRAVLPLPVTKFQAIPGRGAVGRVGKERVQIGAPDWLEEQGLTLLGALRGEVYEAEARGHTVVLCAAGKQILGGFVLEDTLREHAVETVKSIQRMGIAVEMVTGDNERAARTVADQLGIDEVIAGALPADKAAAIKIHQERGHRVAFVGDGINDAPALEQADLGLAVGTGTDVAIESGGAVLVSGDPRLAATALRLARRTFTTIRQNLFWAFVYNCAAIPMAALGHLDPMLAAGAMAFSSVSVVLNSLRLRR